MSSPSQPSGRLVVRRRPSSRRPRPRTPTRRRRPRQHDLELERVRLAHLLRHLPADQHLVGAAAEVAQHAELVLDLRAARDQHERPLDLAEQPAEHLQLLLEQEPGVRREQVGDADGRRVRAVRRAERVVDVEVAAVGELAREPGSFARLARVEARVLEHLDALVREQLAQPRAHGLHRVTRVLVRLRPPEVRADAHLAAPRSSSSSASAATRGSACRRRRARPRAGRSGRSGRARACPRRRRRDRPRPLHAAAILTSASSRSTSRHE